MAIANLMENAKLRHSNGGRSEPLALPAGRVRGALALPLGGFLVALALSGCATVGRPFPYERVQSIVIGETTKAELLSRFADAGCQRVYLWPLGDEARQIELAASEVRPRIAQER